MYAKLALLLLAPASAVQAAYVAAFSEPGCGGVLLGNWTSGVTYDTFGICLFKADFTPIASLYLEPETNGHTSTVAPAAEIYCGGSTGETSSTEGCFTPKGGSFLSFLATSK